MNEIPPMQPDPRLSRRRATLFLVISTCVAPVIGCGGDDTVRGSGSIDIPEENLKLQVAPKGKKGKARR